MKESLLGLARGGLTTEYFGLTCYVDYNAQEYLLGAGDDLLTVAYDVRQTALSYDLYKRTHESGGFRNQPPCVRDIETSSAVEGRAVW